MGLNTLAEMRTDLALMLDSREEADPNTTAGQTRLDRYLNWSYLRIQLPTTFEHVELMTTQTVTLVTSTASYSITPWAIDHVRYNNFEKLLRPMSRTQLSNITIPSGQPSRFARWANTLYLDYIPTSTQNGHTLTIYGWLQPAVLATSSAASSVNTVWDEAIVVGAAWRGWRSMGDHPKSDVYREEYAALVNDNKSVLEMEGHIQGWRAQWGSRFEYF